MKILRWDDVLPAIPFRDVHFLLKILKRKCFTFLYAARPRSPFDTRLYIEQNFQIKIADRERIICFQPSHENTFSRLYRG